MGFFRRMRVICGGQIVKDIDNYKWLHEMYHMMKPTEKRLNDAIEGFGSTDSPSTIPATKTQTVCFTPPSGLLSQDKILPIGYCPIQLEFELVGLASDAVQGVDSTIGHTSELFLIDNVEFKCDLVQLDDSLHNEYAQDLLSGESLPTNLSTFTCSSQVITSLDASVNVQLSFTRLRFVFVSLYKQEPGQDPTRREVNYFASHGTTFLRPCKRARISNANWF